MFSQSENKINNFKGDLHSNLSLSKRQPLTDCTSSPVCLSGSWSRGGDRLVPLHVLFTVDGGPEALLTEWTLVRLQAQVRRHVPGEAAVGRERSTADTAAERLHSCDNGNKAEHGLRYLRITSSKADKDTFNKPRDEGLFPCCGRLVLGADYCQDTKLTACLTPSVYYSPMAALS